jgi:hypothetical protein
VTWGGAVSNKSEARIQQARLGRDPLAGEPSRYWSAGLVMIVTQFQIGDP